MTELLLYFACLSVVSFWPACGMCWAYSYRGSPIAFRGIRNILLPWSKIKQLSVANWLWVLIMTFVFPFVCIPIACLFAAICDDLFYSGGVQRVLRAKPFDKK